MLNPQAGEPGAVIVVGAGVAGLVCAIELHRAGRPVVVLEAADDVGGRVRSSRVDGATIDHGFQVLFTAYPTLSRYLDLDALELRRFQPAARIVHDGRVSLVGDALRDPSLLLDTVVAGALPLGDKLRVLSLRHFARALTVDECFSARFASQSTRTFLQGRGFSSRTIDGFFAPFYGGILLDRTLGTSASILLFTFKMLAEGDTAVPARGMGAITASLAAGLPPGSTRVGVAVASVVRSSDRITGVTLDDGSSFDASHVVLAADPPSSAVLARTAGAVIPVPDGALGCTTMYYRAERSPIPGRALWLNASPDAVVSHAVTLTDVAPEYADAGALIAATAVGQAAALDDESLDRAARRELALMAAAGGARPGGGPPGGERTSLTRLAAWRVPYAQFAQPPGWREERPTISCGVRGLWRASETLHSSSLEGAARGGRDAAQAILTTMHS